MAKNNKQSEAPKGPKPLKLTISRGLEGFDDAWPILTPLFEQLQLVSVDTANPALDALTFAHSAHFFGVVSLERDDDAPNGDDDNGGSESQPLVAFADEVNINNLNDERSMEKARGKNARGVAIKLRPEDLDTGIIGFTYLTSSQNTEDNLRAGELCIGVVIREECRNKGYGQQAVVKTLKIAFENQTCVRVQALLVDSPFKDQALRLFMKSGLGYEGVRKRGFRNPYDYEFKDVTYLGLLATDWLLRDSPGARKCVSAPKSLWDDLFARHQREREELLRWEEKQQVKRTNSMETLKQVESYNANILHAETETDDGEDKNADATAHATGDEESVVGSTSNSGSSVISNLGSSSHGPSLSVKQRRKNIFAKLEERNPRPGPSRAHAELFGNTKINGFQAGFQATTYNILRDHSRVSPAFSDNSELKSDLSDGYTTSTSSQWDVIEKESL